MESKCLNKTLRMRCMNLNLCILHMFEGTFRLTWPIWCLYQVLGSTCIYYSYDTRTILACKILIERGGWKIIRESAILHVCTQINEYPWKYHLLKGFTPNITKTRLCSFVPLKPHFYTVKLGLTGVYINFLISAQKHRLWVLVRTATPRRF